MAAILLDCHPNVTNRTIINFKGVMQFNVADKILVPQEFDMPTGFQPSLHQFFRQFAIVLSRLAVRMPALILTTAFAVQ